jgi:hypothetical protein
VGSFSLSCGCVVVDNDVTIYCSSAQHLLEERVLDEDKRSQACL